MKSSFITVTAVLALSQALLSVAAPADSIRDAKLALRAQQDRAIAARARSSSAESFAKQEYDYIIVGAGTAGLAVAARLSQSGKYTVGVLETGIDAEGVAIMDIPGQFGANLGTIYDYNYTSAANAQTGVPGVYWPRGRVVGGSSALNFLVWDAASEAEYNAWGELGNDGWNWDSLDYYMKKSEKFTAPSQATQDKYDIDVVSSDYGSNGPVKVSFPKYVSKQVQNWIPALKSLGIAQNNQPLNGANVGASVQPSDINPANSTRSYSAPAYYYPNRARKNLALLTNARVDKINWSKSTINNSKKNKIATGVKFTSTTTGKSYNVVAKKEVILSAGTVNSPQILELSGVGSASVLKAAGVTQVIDNANVGENLQDHTYSYAAFELKDGNPTLDSLRWNTTFAAEQTALYQANKVSILDETVPAIAYISLKTLLGSRAANKAIATAKAYIKTVSAPYKATLQKQVDQLSQYPDSIGQMELIGVDGYFAGVGAPESGKNYVTFLSASQHLLARGSIHINSASSADAPTIQPNYLNNQYDIDLAVAGIKMLRKVAASPQYSAYIEKEVVPGPDVQTDDQLVAFLKQKGGFATEYHPIGTTSMLPRNAGGVVDSKLKVYSTDNVRVIDGAPAPLHVSAHVMRTIYGIAEKGADLVLADAKVSTASDIVEEAFSSVFGN